MFFVVMHNFNHLSSGGIAQALSHMKVKLCLPELVIDGGLHARGGQHLLHVKLTVGTIRYIKDFSQTSFAVLGSLKVVKPMDACSVGIGQRVIQLVDLAECKGSS